MILEDLDVFDGSRFIGTHSLAVEGERIAAVEPSSRAPRGTVLPGLIDCHVHLGFFEPRAVLRRGVTTVRDLGWPLERIGDLRGGPDLRFAGRIITAPGGYPSRAGWAPRGTAREVRDADDARAAVGEQAAAGACVIKVAQEPRAGPTMPASVLRAVCDEAHARGLRVTSHCGSLPELEAALVAGFDELAHGLWSVERVPDDVLERMVVAGTVVVPTLHARPADVRVQNLRRFIAAGGRVVYGTDMGNPPVPGGIDPDEFSLLREAGMTVEEALAAATSLAAAHLGLGDRGRVEPGARADLVVVDGDPRDDLTVLGRPSLVVLGGLPVP